MSRKNIQLRRARLRARLDGTSVLQVAVRNMLSWEREANINGRIVDVLCDKLNMGADLKRAYLNRLRAEFEKTA
jgi:hypothetical protein